MNILLFLNEYPVLESFLNFEIPFFVVSTKIGVNLIFERSYLQNFSTYFIIFTLKLAGSLDRQVLQIMIDPYHLKYIKSNLPLNCFNTNRCSHPRLPLFLLKTSKMVNIVRHFDSRDFGVQSQMVTKIFYFNFYCF